MVEDFREPQTFIEFDTIEELDEWFEEETEQIEEEIAFIEEPEEEFIEEEYLKKEAVGRNFLKPQERFNC